MERIALEYSFGTESWGQHGEQDMMGFKDGEVLKRDLDKLESWEITNYMKINTSTGFCTWKGILY